MPQFLIYGLVDPRGGELRYVGQSSKGLSRPRARHHGHCWSWEENLKNAGLKPEIEILEELSSLDQLNDTEIFWIGYFKMLGARLTNMTPGGEGVKGLRLSAERKKAIGDVHRGKIESPETRVRKSLARKGWKYSEETKQKISASNSLTKKAKFVDRYATLICVTCHREFKRLKIHLRSSKGEYFCGRACFARIT